MKYCVLIIDGAAGWPLPWRGGKTSLELAHTPNMDALAREGMLGMAGTVPAGMEPSSACACMSVLGYDPVLYYHGRGAIEARSMGIPVDKGEAVFRCNLVSVQAGQMASYSSGYISSDESRALIAFLNEKLGGEAVLFYPGVGYRHICKIKGHAETLRAVCTPPHDIPGQEIKEFLPRGRGSGVLRDLMERSAAVLEGHPVNLERQKRGEVPASAIWLFWGSGQIPDLPAFRKVYGLEASLTSGVDLLRGLAKMMEVEVLGIAGVTDGPDNDYAAQAEGALRALVGKDMVVVHVEAPDEAGHAGDIDAKVEAIQQVDREIVRRIRDWEGGPLRVLIMPDHPTPIEIRTHVGEEVPFLLWGRGFAPNGGQRFTEREARSTAFQEGKGYNLMSRLVE